MGDFHAFYCAGRIALQRQDPYRTEPLRTCERETGLRAFFAKNREGAVPAPLPGYAIAPFMALAILPVGPAAVIWLVILLASTVAAIVAVARFAAVLWLVPLSAFVLSLGAASIPFGEIVPIAVAAICGAAFFAAKQRWRAAAICGAVAMLEPHLGLPLCLALAVWAPGTRVTLGVCAVVFATLSIAAVGWLANVEYFAVVLPAHALSEAARDTQFSLTSILASLGISDATAVRAGSLSYVAMLAVGVALAGRLALRSHNAAFLACVPPAFAVFGGTFVHVTQMAAAIPAAILFVTTCGGHRRTIAAASVMLLAIPWLMAWSPALGLAPALPVGYLAWRYWGATLSRTLAAALVCALLLIALNHALASAAGHAAVNHPVPSIDPNLAEASWAAFTAKSSNGSLGAWFVRLPTWLGLAILLGLAVEAANFLGVRVTPRSSAAS